MHGQPLGQALFRSQPEDFTVDEIIDFEPSQQESTSFPFILKNVIKTPNGLPAYYLI